MKSKSGHWNLSNPDSREIMLLRIRYLGRDSNLIECVHAEGQKVRQVRSFPSRERQGALSWFRDKIAQLKKEGWSVVEMAGIAAQIHEAGYEAERLTAAA